MATQTQAESKTDDAKESKRVVSGESITGYAVIGCLVAGTIGIFKAMGSEGVGAGACLLASVAAFGTIYYIYYRKD
jgi:hypothetical protein